MEGGVALAVHAIDLGQETGVKRRGRNQEDGKKNQVRGHKEWCDGAEGAERDEEETMGPCLGEMTRKNRVTVSERESREPKRGNAHVGAAPEEEFEDEHAIEHHGQVHRILALREQTQSLCSLSLLPLCLSFLSLAWRI